jgi:shikimate kinase
VKRQIWLIGLPGAGKTTVGELVAHELKAEFVDLDAMIERQRGSSIQELFERFGEKDFRETEREVASFVMGGPPVVVAPGGGWAAQPGAIDEALRTCFVVYLRTEPAEVARRVGDSHGRPLLPGGNREAVIRELLARREPFYLRAEAVVATDGRVPEEVAREVATLARSKAGW